MSLHPRQYRVVVVVFFCSLFLGNIQADELGSFGDRIFQFQKKLALRGNTLAQYKLGTLYEFGISVPPNVEEASKWYRKAAAEQYGPAINRLTYLQIKSSGFKPETHGEWLEELEELADSSDAHALILLGQMHHQGIHVEQNLKTALDMLERASSLGHTEVDSEIEQIQHKLTPLAKPKKTTQAVKAKTSVKPDATVKSAPPKVDREAIARERKLQQEEKRKRYHEQMQKLQEETRLLQEQQQWAEEN